MVDDTMDGKPQKPLIFFIDDNLQMHDDIQAVLHDDGCKTVFTGNGNEALHKMATVTPDLVILDTSVMSMNGDVYRKLGEIVKSSYTPVILVSDNEHDIGTVNDRVTLGVVDTCVKPLAIKDFLAIIKKHIQTSTRWKKLAKSPVTSGHQSLVYKDFQYFIMYLKDRLNLNEVYDEIISKTKPREVYKLCDDLGIDNTLMAKIIADFIKANYIGTINSTDVCLGTMPVRFCKVNNAVIINESDGTKAFVCSNPFDLLLQDVIMNLSEQDEFDRLLITEPENIESIFKAITVPETYKPKSQNGAISVEEETDKGLTEALARAGSTNVGEQSIEELEKSAHQAPVIKMVNDILAKAISAGASDLHIEPTEHNSRIRFRIDGMLCEQDPVPKEYMSGVISRYKIMSFMDFTIRRTPQDGSLNINFRGRKVAARVSTLPSRFGEKIVVRLMDQSNTALDFESLGYEGKALEIVYENIKKSHGILLVTGPTGSGKSTTLYSALKLLNDPAKNLVTLEDPIENNMPGLTQVQINPDVGLTFAAALRSVLRQDPDIIMVGEIRDLETADLAIKAALTGHLVFSTLHTNDAPSTVIRLVDMDVKPYLVASSVEMVIAQRLLRKLCPNCKEPTHPPEQIMEKFKVPITDNMQFFKAVGCQSCYTTGYKGRVSVAEIMEMDDQIRKYIMKGDETKTILNYLVTEVGMRTLQQDALYKVGAGVSTVEEMLRVTG